MQLFDRRHVAYGLRELKDIRAGVPDCSDGICSVPQHGAAFDQADIDAIVEKIIARLKNS